MGRTRKTISVAPFMHRTCQWSGEFAAIRHLELSTEDAATSGRRQHLAEADDSETDLIVLCRSISTELQKGFALRLSEIVRLFSGKYDDFSVHAAAELLVSCGILRRLGPVVPFHTFYAATQTATEPCVGEEGVTFEKFRCGLRKMYESLEKHLHVHKNQPREKTQKARKVSAPLQNVTRRSSDKPPLHPPSKSQDDTDEVKHGENGTYRLEEDLTEEKHHLRVFVKLDKDSAEKEAAIGVRNHPRGLWKFSLHSGFTALPAFSAGLSMKDFLLWLRTTANLKAQSKTGGGLNSRSLQVATDCNDNLHKPGTALSSGYCNAVTVPAPAVTVPAPAVTVPAEKSGKEKSICRSRKQFAAPVAFEVDSDPHLQRQSPERGDEKGSRLPPLARAMSATELNLATSCERSVCIMPDPESGSGSAPVLTREKSASKFEIHLKRTEPQIVQRNPSSASSSLSLSKPVLSEDRGSCVTPAHSASVVVSRRSKSKEGTSLCTDFMEVKSEAEESHQEARVKVPKHLQLIPAADVCASRKSPEHVQPARGGPVSVVSVKAECVAVNGEFPSTSRLQTRRSSQPSADQPFSLSAGSLTLGPMPQKSVVHQPCLTEATSERNTESGAGAGAGAGAGGGGGVVVNDQELRRRGHLRKIGVEKCHGGGSRGLTLVATTVCGRYEGHGREKVAKSSLCPLQLVLNNADMDPGEVPKRKEAAGVVTPRVSVFPAKLRYVPKSVMETNPAALKNISVGEVASGAKEGIVNTNVTCLKPVTSNVESTPTRVHGKRRQNKGVVSEQSATHLNHMQRRSTGIKQIFEALESLLPKISRRSSDKDTACEKEKIIAAMCGAQRSCSRLAKVEPSGGDEHGKGETTGERKRAAEVDNLGQSKTGGARRCRVKQETEIVEIRSKDLTQPLTQPLIQPLTNTVANGEVQKGLMRAGQEGAGSSLGDMHTNCPSDGPPIKRKRGRPQKDVSLGTPSVSGSAPSSKDQGEEDGPSN